MQSSSDKYIREHSSAPTDALSWIEKQTHIRTNYPQMLSGPVQGQLLKMLVELCGAKRIIEIGSFTGYSSTCMALGLPEDGHLDALELNDELEDLMREGWEKAGVSGKISLHIGDAIETLRSLSGQTYDIAFIDANKREYCEYYEAVFPLLHSGSLIIADDVLWDGKLWDGPLPKDAQTRGLARFNDMVRDDRRVEVVMLPLRDGLSLIRVL